MSGSTCPSFPVTHLKVVLPRLPPLQSTVVAPQTKHLQDVQRVRMASEALPFVVPLPDCPRVQAAFCAGLLHPEGADRVIPLPSIKYDLEVVLPTLAEIPQSQALLKEGALLQPAKHPLLPDSQYLWQVTLVQQKEFGSYEAHQTSRAIIPLTEAKASPLHSGLRTDYAFFLICRRARRQRSQSPILVTVRIDKHFKLYIDWSLSGKSKSSQLASQVMESTSTFYDGPISNKESLNCTIQHSKIGHHSWLFELELWISI